MAEDFFFGHPDFFTSWQEVKEQYFPKNPVFRAIVYFFANGVGFGIVNKIGPCRQGKKYMFWEF